MVRYTLKIFAQKTNGGIFIYNRLMQLPNLKSGSETKYFLFISVPLINETLSTYKI